MGFLELALIGVGLSMDAFAVSICKGLSMRKVDKNICLCWRHFLEDFRHLFRHWGGFLEASFRLTLQQLTTGSHLFYLL